MRPKVFQDLVTLDAELAKRTPRPPNALSTFDCSEVGLILRAEEGPLTYSLTPVNTDTFAYTGGNGVHFGFLGVENRSPEHYPVVMTVPMSDLSNHVLGENLHEFLCLGCTYGYFALEQLAYDRGSTIMAIQSGEHACKGDADREELKLLEELCARFNLAPWKNVHQRLRELQRIWKPFIKLSEEGLGFANEWDLPS